MATLDDQGEQSADYSLAHELLWIHGIIRDNLAAITELTRQIVGGAAAQEVQAQVKEIAASSVVWTLRSGCLRYCGLVHAHHHGEDTYFFSGLRRVNPALCPVLDKLEADHVLIAGYLEAVEAAAQRIISDEAARTDLAHALDDLAAHLLTHLDYEEERLTPTLQQLTSWPLA